MSALVFGLLLVGLAGLVAFLSAYLGQGKDRP